MFLNAAINFTDIKSYQNIYKDVFIDTKTSAVLDENLKPIYETLYEIIFWWKGTLHGQTLIDPALRKLEVQRRYEDILTETASITEEDIANAQVLGADIEAIYAMSAHGWYPFGHLHDSLLRLFPWKNHYFKNPRILCSKYNRVVDFPLHLKAFGYDESTILQTASKYRLIKVSQLYFGVNEAPFWTGLTEAQYRWMLTGYLSLLTEGEKSLPEITGIYLSRNHVGRRGVLNDEDVQNFLKNKGFIVLTGNEDLKEIISLFYRAKTIVGPHGSIFVNTIFCKKDAKVIEFCPDNRRDYSFKGKKKLVENYQHILIKGDSDFNIKIDLNQLEELLS